MKVRTVKMCPTCPSERPNRLPTIFTSEPSALLSDEDEDEDDEDEDDFPAELLHSKQTKRQDNMHDAKM
jgi:hypothetical protein